MNLLCDYVADLHKNERYTVLDNLGYYLPEV
jgi:hypothetical protein